MFDSRIENFANDRSHLRSRTFIRREREREREREEGRYRLAVISKDRLLSLLIVDLRMSNISTRISARSNDLFGGSQAPLMLYGFDRPYGGTLKLTGYDIKESSRLDRNYGRASNRRD